MNVPAPDRARSPLLPAKAFYFLYFAALSCLLPYLVLYYEALGIPGRRIGVLAAIPYLLMPLAAPTWSGLGDATRRHKTVLLVAVGGTWLAVAGILVAPSFAGLVVFVALFATFNSPIMALIDNTTMELLGEERGLYGRQRLWGAVGWGLTAPLIGWIIDRAGLRAFFVGYFVMMAPCIAVALSMPIRPAPLIGRFWSNVGLLVSDGPWLVFLVAVFFGGFGTAIVHIYLFLHMQHLGASKALMGLAMSFSTGSELLVMLFSEKILRLGSRRVFLASLVLLAVRLGLLGMVGRPLAVLPIQLLHGFTFGTMWIAGVAYAHKLAPRGFGTTAQGMFGGTYFGLGACAGALAGGLMYQYWGSARMFVYGGLGSLVGAALYLAASRLVPERDGD